MLAFKSEVDFPSGAHALLSTFSVGLLVNIIFNIRCRVPIPIFFVQALRPPSYSAEFQPLSVPTCQPRVWNYRPCNECALMLTSSIHWKCSCEISSIPITIVPIRSWFSLFLLSFVCKIASYRKWKRVWSMKWNLNSESRHIKLLNLLLKRKLYFPVVLTRVNWLRDGSI